MTADGLPAGLGTSPAAGLATSPAAGLPASPATSSAAGPAAGLALTEAVLTEALDGVPGSLREPCRRIACGGNRLRAGLVLAVAGRAWPGTSRRTATAAAAVELLHLATLVHDDLRDEVPVRDGVPTINAGEGPATALLAGDMLIGLANRLAATAGTGPLLGDALAAVCAGQALEADHRFHTEVSAGTALRVAELRTGTMLATAGLLGAVVTGAPAGRLREYGLAFGTAVHLLGNVETLPRDFAAGRITLPVVHAFAAHPEPRPDHLCAGVPATLRTVDDLVEQAAAAQPELAELPRRYRDSQLALLLPRYPSALSS